MRERLELDRKSTSHTAREVIKLFNLLVWPVLSLLGWVLIIRPFPLYLYSVVDCLWFVCEQNTARTLAIQFVSRAFFSFAFTGPPASQSLRPKLIGKIWPRVGRGSRIAQGCVCCRCWTKAYWELEPVWYHFRDSRSVSPSTNSSRDLQALKRKWGYHVYFFCKATTGWSESYDAIRHWLSNFRAVCLILYTFYQALSHQKSPYYFTWWKS